MTDNPLADWLRAHEGRAADVEGPDAGDTSPAWPGSLGGDPPAGPEDGSAPWEHPPEPGRPDRPDVGGPLPGRRGLLLLLAALPWAVVAGLAAAALSGGPSPSPDTAASPEEETSPSADDASTPTRPGGPERVPSGADPALGAAAALAVRLAVTTGDGDERRYVDLAVPEAWEWTGDVVVVTVAALVLEGSGDRWHTARPARFAVPLSVVDGQAVALDEPWALPALSLTPEPPAWEPASADPEGVARALAAAGYTDVDVLGVEAPAGLDEPLLLLRARLRAQAPGDAVAGEHHVWLRAEPSPAVLGAPR